MSEETNVVTIPKPEEASPVTVVVKPPVVVDTPKPAVAEVSARVNPTLGTRGPRLHGVDPKSPEGSKKIMDALDGYLIIQKLDQPQTFNWRVTCCECGWQTHQLSLEEAKEVVKTHCVRHLYSV